MSSTWFILASCASVYLTYVSIRHGILRQRMFMLGGWATGRDAKNAGFVGAILSVLLWCAMLYLYVQR